MAATKEPKATERRSGEEPLARKNFRLHQSKIDAAKKILGTKTETETVEMALDMVTFGERLLAGVDAMRGTELIDIFAEEAADADNAAEAA